MCCEEHPSQHTMWACSQDLESIQNCMPFADLALCQALICLLLAQESSWSYCEHKSVPRHGTYTVRCTI